METFSLRVIARVRTDFPQKFGLPRQSGLVPELKGVVEFEEGYCVPEAVRGLEGFSHIWLLWGFSMDFASSNGSGTRDRPFSPTVRPPRLGGNERMGVFATRSPNRPNPVALSAVRLDRVEPETPKGPLLYVSGIDMADGSPVYDIKPYLPLTDCIPDASGGFAEKVMEDGLTVELPPGAAAVLSPEQRTGLEALLRADPRPSYRKDDEREYGFSYAGFEVKFRVHGNVLTVEEILSSDA
jgi:tRNA-Thr(GGU) m(6)t(6)A37 methyltransferase TsaA